MNDEKMQSTIGRLLFIGVVISLMIVLAGGIYYLVLHGGEHISHQTFQGEQKKLGSVFDIFYDAFSLSPQGIIEFGLLLLVLVQILRVALTTWMFIKMRERIFVFICLFIFLVLVYSLISPI